jgi:hypothetical protein
MAIAARIDRCTGSTGSEPVWSAERRRHRAPSAGGWPGLGSHHPWRRLVGARSGNRKEGRSARTRQGHHACIVPPTSERRLVKRATSARRFAPACLKWNFLKVMSDTPSIHPDVRIGHVHLKVADLDRALAFYCGVLGFQLTQHYDPSAAFISAGGIITSAQHVGKSRRLSATARQHGTLPLGDSLSDAR